MPRRENLLPLLAVSTLLAIAVLIAFQIYLIREPARLEADTAADVLAAQSAGDELFAAQCVACHGDKGQGGLGPALNSKPLLSRTSDDLLFNLIRTGVPGTSMPAWGQVFGGPLTDEEVRQVVAYLRAWEASAPVPEKTSAQPDPARGALIFNSTCIVCHGQDGIGTDRAPALNDRQLLDTFDDEWFRQTIAEGRPSKGMPTWGTVLSPEQIGDLVALIGAWRGGEAARPAAAGDEPFVQGMPVSAFFLDTCSGCHGPTRQGATGPALLPQRLSQPDAYYHDVIKNGKPGTVMPPWGGMLSDAEIDTLINFIRSAPEAGT
ncbi:MAG TPA: c-type cytochrome [Anaerolineales bacterium]|nr:c-type cytochrome [Anaerolineales bacterium]